MSMGYVGWIAFLVFWLVFGRALVFFYMSTAVFGGFASGFELDLAAERRDVEHERAFAIRIEENGAVLADPALLGMDCRVGPLDGRRPRLEVEFDRRLRYNGMVAALEALDAETRILDCAPLFEFAPAPEHRLDQNPADRSSTSIR